MKIKTKIFLSFLITGAILTTSGVVIFYFVSSNNLRTEIANHLSLAAKNKANWINSYFLERKGDVQILAISPSVQNTLNAKLAADVELAKKEIEQISKWAGQEIGDYIKKHPQLTVKDLQNDPNFQKIAVQPVGQTGYTAVQEHDTLINRFHKNPKIVDTYLGDLATKLPAFWKVMSKNKGGQEVEGFYDWAEADGSIKQKYMYITPIQAKTADGIGLSVAATTYLNEYESTIQLLHQAEEYLKNFKNSHGYDNLFLMTVDGNVWWTAEPTSELGTNLTTGQFKGTQLATAYRKANSSGQAEFSDYELYQPDNKPAVFIATPLYTKLEGEEKTLIGLAALQLGTEQINKITRDRTGLGETGETYLIGQDYLMRSNSTFSEESTVLKQKVDTENSKECLTYATKELYEPSSGSNIKTFSSYRGIKVFSTYVGIPAMKWCLLAEIEQSEALAPVNKLFWLLILTGLLFIVIFLIFANLTAKRITNPIKALRQGVEIIERGDLSHQVGTASNDEIGQLSRAFDEMTLAIKKSRAEVDKKVATQTKEIREKQELLEDQQKTMLNILSDVQEEKENVANEKDKIDAILRGISDGVLVISQDYQITMFNEVAEQITGLNSQEILGKKYDQTLRFILENNEKTNDEFIAKAMSTGQIAKMSNHTILVRPDGVKMPVSGSAASLHDKTGKVTGCVIVFRDTAKEREIDKAKTEFVSLASHQLRTPLSTINWYTEMLLNGDAGEINENQKEYLGEIYHGNQRMVSLVNALLNVSRIELGTLAIDIKPTNLAELADSVLTELSPQIKNKELALTKEYESHLPEVKVDPKLIRIVFQNLLSNAVEYTPPKGKIQLNLAKNKSNILITVADTGYGIPENQQSRIFTKLFRGDNVKAKKTEGTGLGLYLVKAVVEEAGGKIWFESQENKGTTFYATIPLEGMKTKKGTKSLT